LHLSLRMKTAPALLIGLTLVAGCGRPASDTRTSPVSESWNPPKDSTNVVILYSSVQGGKAYKFEVPRARVEKLPDWSAASTTIPLQPQQAGQLALAWYQSRHPSITNLQASSISLQRISWYETKWAYQVFLVPPEKSRPFEEPKDSISTVVVLLDGTIVDPVIDPDANRRPRINL
jgi:hypothetical protein